MVHSKTRALGVAAVAGAVALALTVAGCSSTPTASSSSLPKHATISILANITPALTKQYYQGLVAPYVKAHPGIKVNIEVPTADNVQDTLQQELASGSTPDIVASSLTSVVAPQLVSFPKSGWVLDTPLAQQDEVNGKIVQVATGTQIQSLVFYNKDAFKKAGISSVPKSVSEYTSDLKALTAAGYVGFDTSGDWVPGAQFEMLADPALLSSDPDWFAKRASGGVKFAGSAYDRWLETYQQWVGNGSLPKSSLGIKYADTITEFTSGKAATYVMGNWVVPSIDSANPSFSVGVFSVPTFNGKTSDQMSGPAQPYSILKASKNQAIDLDLVKYLVTDKSAVATSLKSEGNFRKGYSYPGSPLNEAVAKILDEAPGLSAEATNLPIVPGTFGTELNTTVQSMITGTSASSASNGLDTWWATNGTTN